MNERKGAVYSIGNENQCVKGCTISKTVIQDNINYITHFALAKETTISAEYYLHPSLFIVSRGNLLMEFHDRALEKTTDSLEVKSLDAVISPVESFYGFKAREDCVYTEIGLSKELKMNSAIKNKDVFSLRDLIPYQDGKIVNMDIISDPKTVFEVMAFDAGCGLPEHAAPGEALIFALDGKGIITYEGKDYPIEAGQNFVFEKGGLHAVKAVTKFKMALLLTK